jgi:hypothetical protein
MGHSNPGGQHQAGVSNVAGPNIPYHSLHERRLSPGSDLWDSLRCPISGKPDIGGGVAAGPLLTPQNVENTILQQGIEPRVCSMI